MQDRRRSPMQRANAVAVIEERQGTLSDDPSVDTPIERPVDTTPTSSSSSSRSTTQPTSTAPTSTQPALTSTSSSSSSSAAPTTAPTTSASSTTSVPPPTTAPTTSASSLITSAPTPTSFQTVTSTDGTGGVVTVISTLGAQATGTANQSSGGSDVNIGAIIGGIAGGVAGLIILVYLILLPIRRRAQKQREIEWLAFEADHHNTDSSAAAVFGRGGPSSNGHGLKANSSIGGSVEAAAYGMSEVGHASPEINRAESHGHGGQAGVGAGLYTHLDQGSATWQQQQQQQGAPVDAGGYAAYNQQQQQGYEGYYGAAGQSTELGYYNAPSPEQHPQQFRGSPQMHPQQQQGYNYAVNANGAPQLAPTTSLSHSNSYHAASPTQQQGLVRQPSEVMPTHHGNAPSGQWADTSATAPYTSSPQLQATRQRTVSRSGSIDSRREAEARGGLHVVNDN